MFFCVFKNYENLLSDDSVRKREKIVSIKNNWISGKLIWCSACHTYHGTRNIHSYFVVFLNNHEADSWPLRKKNVETLEVRFSVNAPRTVKKVRKTYLFSKCTLNPLSLDGVKLEPTHITISYNIILCLFLYDLLE